MQRTILRSVRSHAVRLQPLSAVQGLRFAALKSDHVKAAGKCQLSSWPDLPTLPYVIVRPASCATIVWSDDASCGQQAAVRWPGCKIPIQLCSRSLGGVYSMQRLWQDQGRLSSNSCSSSRRQASAHLSKSAVWRCHGRSLWESVQGYTIGHGSSSVRL